MKIRDVVVATHNKGKAREIAEMLMPMGIHVTFSGALRLPEPEETGHTFEANALLKAETAANLSGRVALADDSGLTVSALAGAPGIYSARWAGKERDFSLAMTRVKQELEAKGLNPVGQTAAFVCVLAVAFPKQANLPSVYFEGRVLGTLTFPPRGNHGFGYDPIFIPDGHTRTFGQMEAAQKQKISHRAKAFEEFKKWATRWSG